MIGPNETSSRIRSSPKNSTPKPTRRGHRQAGTAHSCRARARPRLRLQHHQRPHRARATGAPQRAGVRLVRTRPRQGFRDLRAARVPGSSRPTRSAIPQNLRLRTRINGELRQSSMTSNMIFNCAHLIHFFSANFTLRPGMLIATGTPGGTAWSTTPNLAASGSAGQATNRSFPPRAICNRRCH